MDVGDGKWDKCRSFGGGYGMCMSNSSYTEQLMIQVRYIRANLVSNHSTTVERTTLQLWSISEYTAGIRKLSTRDDLSRRHCFIAQNSH